MALVSLANVRCDDEATVVDALLWAKGMGGPVDDFLNVVDIIYKGDPAYVRPLDALVKDQINPRKNPFFEHGEGAMFCAYKGGVCVGRVTAHIDRAHLDRYNDATGFFTATGDLLLTGPTLTNVNDIRVILVD